MAFAARRLRNSSLLGFGSVAMLLLAEAHGLAFGHTAFLSGWMLLVLMVLLALYNGRKKLPFLPLLPSSIWLQFHIYGGMLAVLLLGIHVDFDLPEGLFESVLVGLALVVLGSGLVGLLLSRTLPRYLSKAREEVIFERIPIFARRLREDLKECVERASSINSSPVIVKLQVEYLLPFFGSPRKRFWYFFRTLWPRRSLLDRIEDCKRYLNQEERTLMDEMKELVEVKSDLDYQYTLQAALKYWLFVHIPATYALFLFVLVHVVLVLAFSDYPR